MPPVKRQLRISVDADVASYLEDQWDEIRKAAKKRTIYLSTFMNVVLGKMVDEDRSDKRFTEYARKRLLDRH